MKIIREKLNDEDINKEHISVLNHKHKPNSKLDMNKYDEQSQKTSRISYLSQMQSFAMSKKLSPRLEEF